VDIEREDIDLTLKYHGVRKNLLIEVTYADVVMIIDMSL
jgi:hypothetical protein